MLQALQEHTRILDVIVVLFTGIVIAAVSSWITVQLSLRRFRSERWWERKAEAYENIIGALHDSKAFADVHLEAEYEQRDIPKETANELRDRSKAAHLEIAKAIDIGAFILPEKALARLTQFRQDEANASNSTMWHEYLEADWKATDRCLKDLIQIAKRDLRTK